MKSVNVMFFGVSLLASCLLPFTSASAEPLFSKADDSAAFNASPTQSSALERIKSDPAARSVTVVRIDSARVRANRNIELNLQGVTLGVKAGSVQNLEGGRFVWTGEIGDGDRATGELPEGEAIIVFSGDNATGTIRTPDGALFRLEPIGGGLNALIEVDQTKLPPDHGPGDELPEGAPKSRTDYDNPDARNPDLADTRDGVEEQETPEEPVEEELEEPGEQTEVEGKEPDATQAKSDTKALVWRIDLVVAQTRDVANAYGQMGALIDFAILETNKSFAASGIPAVVRLVKRVQYNYPEAGKTRQQMLADFSGNGDRKMDSIHRRRDEFGGDIAILIVENLEVCGRAFQINATRATAFLVVKRSCVQSNLTFPHEIGHLAGCRHDRNNDDTDTPYAFGHGFQRGKRNATIGGYRTIMSLACPNNDCDRRLPYWSNPRITYQSRPLGDPGFADNSRVWAERARTLSGFRSQKVSSPSADANATVADVRAGEFTDDGTTASDTRVGEFVDDDMTVVEARADESDEEKLSDDADAGEQRSEQFPSDRPETSSDRDSQREKLPAPSDGSHDGFINPE